MRLYSVLSGVLLSMATISGYASNHSRSVEQVLDAAVQNDQQQLKYLANNSGLDQTDNLGRSAILLALIDQNYQAMQILLTMGANPDYYDQALSGSVTDPTPLLHAGARGDIKALKILLEAGANTSILNYYGGTALIPAAEKGFPDAVDYLLDHSDVNINHVNRLGWTALMEVAVLSDGGPDHQRITRSLLEHGADPNIPDNQGITALAHARSRGLKEIVEILKDAGAI